MVAVRLPGVLAFGVRGSTTSIRGWPVWALRAPLRGYLIGVTALAVAVAVPVAVRTTWRPADAAVFGGLIACGLVAIESTRRVTEVHGTVSRDLQTVWYLAIAIALPPAYALLAPIPLAAYRLWRVRRGLVYRRVFSNATISLAYGGASVAFHAVPARWAGAVPGAGSHVLTWVVAAAGCGALAWVINNGLLLGAITLADPGARLRDLFGNREAITSDLIELSLAVSLALVVAINPVLMALALPSVLLYRRYVLTAQLVGQARIDAKTGLLNAGTWRQEADVELTRALRTRASLVLVIVHVDHLESVQDTAGRPAADQVLRAIAGTLTDNLRGYDLVGRFGGEEFAVLLPHTDTGEARWITERLRDNIAGQPIAIEDGARSGFIFRLTVSIGIAALDQSRRGLAELIGAACAAVTEAKTLGRNRVCVTPGGGAVETGGG
jgi:diguanylate cyclase (GGDEF)-like protein